MSNQDKKAGVQNVTKAIHLANTNEYIPAGLDPTVYSPTQWCILPILRGHPREPKIPVYVPPFTPRTAEI